MNQRTMRGVLLMISGVLLTIALLIATVPALGQDGLSAEEQAQLMRAVAVVDAAATYNSYHFTSGFDLAIDWRVFEGGAALGGADITFTRAEDATFVRGEGQPNIQRTIAITQTVADANGPATRFAVDGEVRQVDGLTFASAAYTEAEGESLPELPPDWVALPDAAPFDLWPGLNTVLSPRELDGPVGMEAAFIPFLTYSSAQLDGLLAAVSAVTTTPATLPDGSPAQAISVTVDAAGVRPLEDYFNPDDMMEQAIAAAVEGDILTITLLVDDAEHLRGIDYTFRYTLADLDISGVGGTPEGITLSITHQQTYTSRFETSSAFLVLTTAPDIPTQTDLPGFQPPVASGDLRWWNDRVFYEVFVRSFYDSDGDGTGDLQGLIAKLDYLNDGDPATTDDLGITGIWLMPVAQSPSYHGYDVIDYTTIEEDYGTNADFRQLMAEAHARGIAVIVDLVLNHTSSEHPWFLAAQAGDPAFEDYYIWAEEDPGWRSPWGAPVWHQAANGQYYYGLFWSGMPDLNYATPAVSETMDEVIRFWLEDMGVDGFRLDAIRHLFEDGAVLENTPETLAWLEGFDDYVHHLSPKALTVGEIWDSTAEVAPYITGDRVDVAFEFDLAEAILSSVQAGQNAVLYQRQNAILEAYPQGQYAAFLTNHDQNRVMSQLAGNVPQAKAAATLLLTNPGVPFIYYGEEIGMVGEKPDERIRTPMQWDGSRVRAGFTDSTPWQTVQHGYSAVNVALQTDDPASLLSHYRALASLRSSYAALRTGPMQLVASSSSHVYSFLRYGEDHALLVVVNLSNEPVTDYTLEAPASHLPQTVSAEILLGQGAVEPPTITEGGAFASYTPLDTLPPYGSAIIRLR